MNNDADQKVKFFKPEDFENLSVTKDNLVPEIAAEIANDKLEKLIESWPVVYGRTNLENEILYGTVKAGYDTHKARLAFIEPLLREPCKHEPTEIGSPVWDEKKVICKYCGVKLIATWNAK